MLLGCGIAPLPDVMRHFSGLISKDQNAILLGHILILKDEIIIFQNVGHQSHSDMVPNSRRTETSIYTTVKAQRTYVLRCHG
jgi:hypothetical protein